GIADNERHVMKTLTAKTLIFFLLMVAVAAAGWFGRKAYQSSAERRFVAQARHYLVTNDVRNTALCLQRALQINPMSAPASRLMADMLEATGSASALQGRIHACRYDSNNVQYRLAWAQTALKLHNPGKSVLALNTPKSN